MDLQVLRNVEQLVSLLRLPQTGVADILEIHQSPYGLRLEVIDDRLMLTSWLIDIDNLDLERALKRNQPERFKGLPQRLFTIKRQLYISTFCPHQFDARQWFEVCKKQREFLMQLVGENKL
ncbi:MULTISPECIES: hypothetical protein [Vibrio]|uniref:Uncharacterized protein n=1 Tax=Vibrio aquimaris TaxID=2587862 RepID=A0A5P9CIZ2_9VIBR|nr:MULTISPECIES: hypothetical protein [Vibrio]QFT26230.1 hypothetical protein FIV01_07300 [Vibrio aquimaris]